MNINKNYTFSDSNETKYVLEQLGLREFSTTTNREASYVDTQEVNENKI
jgi:hypothetical protein